ncbi:Fur family transcriptional regulator [Candidatus Methylacidithermus pantelleriae]|uniref:Peroxide stress regulator Ferric uptake regulation protein Fe2+/Zn2+ uptake regulation proteins n=1 Tax=Candidatus Methylacidithermus pantelleriae TaxID=2744239 RepID=A0A8J2BHM9_9BACT|nr:transcriptional repressor [Candidatus Methylacidithermus pantelleriae]CAF0695412.1 Peroxide stress regulator; Ferric uptake regulation protein; Fe2+/Zn2+ uptake regulation proteins [Candidatus Methylacidithermus pantelleriae]
MERQTRQRRAIAQVLVSADGPLTPGEILQEAAREVPGLGLATVYRCLRSFLAQGLVCVVGIPGEAPRYEITGKGHHHHFLCRGCGRIFEIPRCIPEDIALLAPPSFRVESHEIILYGKCRDCVSPT